MTKPTTTWILATVGSVVVSIASAPSQAAKTAPPLPPPDPGQVTVVYVSNPSELQSAIAGMGSDTTIMLEPGTYDMTNVTAARWIAGKQNIALRGTTGNRDEVVLEGTGMTGGAAQYIFQFSNCQDVLVADMTLRNVYHHLIHTTAGCSDMHFYNLRLNDCRTQFCKIQSTDGGLVEYCQFDFTDPNGGPDDYMHGIDCLDSDNWVIRDNTFLHLRYEPGLSGGAILMWHGCQDTIVERNEFIRCDFGVAFGNPGGDDPDHVRGIIRNNFFYRDASTSGDVAITLNRAQDAKVYNNTCILNGTFSWVIDGRYASTTAEIYCNITDGNILPRDGATLIEVGNLENAGSYPEWFVDVAGGDLHLSAAATAAINQASVLADVTDDYDWDARPFGSAPDIGADEFVPRGDLDYDGDVDLDDWTLFEPDLVGPGNVPGNWQADLDGDGDCDLGDVAIFVGNFTGLL